MEKLELGQTWRWPRPNFGLYDDDYIWNVIFMLLGDLTSYLFIITVRISSGADVTEFPEILISYWLQNTANSTLEWSINQSLCRWVQEGLEHWRQGRVAYRSCSKNIALVHIVITSSIETWYRLVDKFANWILMSIIHCELILIKSFNSYSSFLTENRFKSHFATECFSHS